MAGKFLSSRVSSALASHRVLILPHEVQSPLLVGGPRRRRQPPPHSIPLRADAIYLRLDRLGPRGAAVAHLAGRRTATLQSQAASQQTTALLPFLPIAADTARYAAALQRARVGQPHRTGRRAGRRRASGLLPERERAALRQVLTGQAAGAGDRRERGFAALRRGRVERLVAAGRLAGVVARGGEGRRRAAGTALRKVGRGPERGAGGRRRIGGKSGKYWRVIVAGGWWVVMGRGPRST